MKPLIRQPGPVNRVNLGQPMPQPPSSAPSASGLARAYALTDPRYNAKKDDRPGVSRGRGQMAEAGVRAATNFAQAISDVYGDQLTRQSANADAMLQARRDQERYGQALADLQSQAVYADRADRLGILQGLLGNY